MKPAGDRIRRVGKDDGRELSVRVNREGAFVDERRVAVPPISGVEVRVVDLAAARGREPPERLRSNLDVLSGPGIVHERNVAPRSVGLDISRQQQPRRSVPLRRRDPHVLSGGDNTVTGSTGAIPFEAVPKTGLERGVDAIAADRVCGECSSLSIERGFARRDPNPLLSKMRACPSMATEAPAAVPLLLQAARCCTAQAA